MAYKTLFIKTQIMEMQENKKSDYVAYEYLSVDVKKELEPIYTDCYENLGWQAIYGPEQENLLINQVIGIMVNIKFRRARKIKNRSMLLSLQRKCEGALHKIDKMEKSKELNAMIISLSTGIAGLGFCTGAVFGLMAGEILLAIVLVLLGCIGFAFPLTIYKKIRIKQEAKVASLIEEQYDLIYGLCEQAKNLLA